MENLSREINDLFPINYYLIFLYEKSQKKEKIFYKIKIFYIKYQLN